jgi:DNA-binding NtrC family response regulator
MKGKLLIVEDQFIEANNLRMILERSGYGVCEIARSVPIALKIIENDKPDLVLLDIFLQGPLTGIDLGMMLKEKRIAFVYLSANSNKETLDAAKATCPYGFLVKPFREKDVLVMLEIAHYLHANTIESFLGKKKNSRNDMPPSAGTNFNSIIGKSEKLQAALEFAAIVAPTETSVLILGESGTGKEGIATSIHELSARRKEKMVKVNCAALPASLAESALFGHERGAFTGATERKIGKFEQADKGTLFLDEVGELSVDLQSKLLRVLQEKEIERVGGTDTIKVDVRVIAATNRNLEKEVAEGRFRLDLYYRLNVFPIELPALRDRAEDIPSLIDHFIIYYNRKSGKKITGVSEKILKKMIAYKWPGNIRELENVIEREMLLAKGTMIEEFSIRDAHHDFSTGDQDMHMKTIDENERDYIIAVLKKCKGKIWGPGGAAEILDVPPTTLNSKMKKLGIKKEEMEDNN